MIDHHIERPMAAAARNGWLRRSAAAAIVLCLLCSQAVSPNEDKKTGHAKPAEDAAGENSGASCFAQVWLVSGEVNAVAETGSRPLQAGDAVFVGETIRAAAQSEAVFKTADAGLVALRPGAEFVTESYAAQARNTDHLRLRISRGSLRLVSGWIGQINREGVQIFTPEARIGIRGTDHEPFVLPEDLADATPYEAGSYDKVNRGRTVLATTAGELELRAGQTGFASAPETPPAAKSPPPETHRGLLTLLMPALLERIPSFYTAGRFEQDIDSYSQQADAYAKSLLQERQAGKKPSAACAPAPHAELDSSSVARSWISQFDAGLVAHDAQSVLDLFDRDAVIEAMVLENGGGIVTSHFDRAQFLRSVGDATAQLKNYHQDRQTLDAHIEMAGADQPRRVRIKSHVVEQGQLAGRDYRTESDEDYLLEYRDGRWLAVRALTIQR
jgi:hypothetical protein